MESGRTILGTDGHRQPDWFIGNAETLKPLHDLQNAFLLIVCSLRVITINRDLSQNEELLHRLGVLLISSTESYGSCIEDLAWRKWWCMA